MDRLGIKTLRDHYKTPAEYNAWLVENRLIMGGLGLLVGQPKAGKSTLARCLAVAVMRGKQWFGFDTTAGPVIYFAMEEKRAQAEAHFQSLGVTEEDVTAGRIYITYQRPGAHPTAQDAARKDLRLLVEHLHPVLVIIDTMNAFLQVEDTSDYPKMGKELAHFAKMARETGPHILVVHHLGWSGHTLGSVAIEAGVDVVWKFKRSGKKRSIVCESGRYGVEFDALDLDLDKDTGEVVVKGKHAENEWNALKPEIVKYLRSISPEGRTAKEIGLKLTRNQQLCRQVCHAMHAAGEIMLKEKGTKKLFFLLSGADNTDNGSRNSEVLIKAPTTTTTESAMTSAHVDDGALNGANGSRGASAARGSNGSRPPQNIATPKKRRVPVPPNVWKIIHDEVVD
jgi:energy-coupling factor transporter ATP-binding protein EcfA2